MFGNDRKIRIAVGKSRWSKNWSVREMLWSEFVEKLSKPERTQEGLKEYKSYPKKRQDEIKDIGGYMGGELTGALRRNENAGPRYLVTLDADNIPAGGTQPVINAVEALGCSYVIYSTRKHESAAPRLRIIFPLDAPCPPDEYEPIARKLAQCIGMQIFDPTTFEVVRLMYWPSCSKDSEYVFLYGDKPFLSKDGVLTMYQDWRDAAQWPEAPGAAKLRDRSAKKQGDPLEKQGVVGAFCRVYDVRQAIAEFLADVYEPHGEERYTYLEGSTVGGAVLYENGRFLYSHHATDPAGGRLCNSFDLVRIHLFREADLDAKPDTPVTQLPSFKSMCGFAVEKEPVSRLLSQERYERAQGDFRGPAGPEAKPRAEENYDWMTLLRCSARTGMPEKTIDNIVIVLNHDPKLAGHFYHDEFANRPVVESPLPWDIVTGPYKPRIWVDEDDAGLRHYLEKVYGISSKEKTYDAMAVYAVTHKKHKIRDYLNSLTWDGIKRLDTLLVDYFGAADTPYTRSVTRKTLAAAVARVHNPGCKFDTMLILSGDQGIGKSTFFRFLGKDWYSDSLATFEGRDAAELIQGYWIIEAGELTGMNKTEMNTVKQFLSKVEDVYREPYGRRTSPFPRSCIIVGTTNNTEFLKDITGNRRFWPVDLGKTTAVKKVFTHLPGEADQIWAEAVVRWQCGEKLYLEGEEAKEAIEQQEAHKERSPREGIIREFLEKKIPVDWNTWDVSRRNDFWTFGHEKYDISLLVERNRICAAEIWCECFRKDIALMRRTDALEINGILAGVEGWTRAAGALKYGKYYGVQKGYIRVT